jgi:hypothetical protein
VGRGRRCLSCGPLPAPPPSGRAMAGGGQTGSPKTRCYGQRQGRPWRDSGRGATTSGRRSHQVPRTPIGLAGPALNVRCPQPAYNVHGRGQHRARRAWG